MAKVHLFVTAITIAATFSGCSEQSMFQKCISKEVRDIDQLSYVQMEQLKIAYAGPYYDTEIARLSEKYIEQKIDENLIAAKEKILKYKSDSDFMQSILRIYIKGDSKLFDQVTAAYDKNAYGIISSSELGNIV